MDKKIILHPLVNGVQQTDINLFPQTISTQVLGLAEVAMTGDYNDLINTPEQSSNILYGTKDYWNNLPDLLTEKGTIYVYIDAFLVDGVSILGIKIGDGSSFLKDMPFVGDNTSKVLASHINDTSMHIQPGERNFWNNKLNYSYSSLDNGVLEFNRY